MILPGITGNWASKNAKKVQNLQNNSTAVGSVSPHSHDNSNENSQQIPPIAPPQPDNITGNLTNNQVIQDKGKALWQGEEMANQFATRQMDQPVPPPGDPTGDQYGNMFSPFSQKNIVAAPVPQRPIIEPNLETYKVPQVAIEPTKKIYKKPTKQLMREVPRMHKHEEKMEKPREMPKKVIPPTNLIGGVKKPKDPNKGRPYVVNKEKTGTSRDTLYLPKDTYVSKDGYAEDSDIDNAARKAAAQGIYNYTEGQRNFNFEYLEGSGKVKYKK